MRIIFLIIAVVLTGCATPQTAPDSFYGEVYTPGGITVTEQGEYRSTAGVFAKQDREFARKAAYARLLISAREAGYRYFSISDEKQVSLIAHRYVVTGGLYKARPSGVKNYPVEAITRLLRGLPLQEVKPRKLRKTARAPSRPKAAPAAPASSSARPEASADDPLVIMAPEDITGSIRKTGSSAVTGLSSGIDGSQAELTDSDLGQEGARRAGVVFVRR